MNGNPLCLALALATACHPGAANQAESRAAPQPSPKAEAPMGLPYYADASFTPVWTSSADELPSGFTDSLTLR